MDLERCFVWVVVPKLVGICFKERNLLIIYFQSIGKKFFSSTVFIFETEKPKVTILLQTMKSVSYNFCHALHQTLTVSDNYSPEIYTNPCFKKYNKVIPKIINLNTIMKKTHMHAQRKEMFRKPTC